MFKGVDPTVVIAVATLFVLATVLKGMALWQAGVRKQKHWFIALFLLNTAGVLPIIYLLTRKSKSKNAKEKRARAEKA